VIAMNTRRVAAIALRQFYLIRGSITRTVPLFFWAGIDIVLWGFITRYLNSVASVAFDFVPVLLGAVLLWNFFMRVMQGVTLAFFEDVWSRNFLNIFASPLTIGEYLTGLVVTSIATSAVSVVAMLLLAAVVFGLSFASYGVALFALVFALFLFGIALGVAACSVVLRFGPSAEWFVWPIPGLVSPFAGVFYPIATLPRWMQTIAAALPPSYVFEGLRALVTGGTVGPGPVVIATVLSVAYLLGASWLFTRVYRQAVRTGLIARYSAESFS
jgi:ABC-2 type transport system permease protein